VREPYVYLDYTHSSSSGSVDRVSRFTISGDRLGSEKVIVDGIPGGSCNHFGGRIKFGPDGRLYITSGEGFVAARAASHSNLSGKILSVNADGTDLKVFAWGFRNPQGLAFDSSGRLYASNNGPSGDLGLCCHDSIYQVRQDGFYGWPWWAANVRTSYSAGTPPARTPPIAESDDSTWAPSGIAFFTAHKGERPTLIIAELRGQALRRLVIDPSNPSQVTGNSVVFSDAGRMRDVEPGPDGCLYALTSNRDGRGSPGSSDDRVLKLCVA
jgi:glucose/arabinose dehydrogenase